MIFGKLFVHTKQYLSQKKSKNTAVKVSQFFSYSSPTGRGFISEIFGSCYLFSFGIFLHILSYNLRKFLVGTSFFRRFFNLFRSVEQRLFIEYQGWSSFKQRWSAQVFYAFSETALFSAEYLWNFNPGSFIDRQECIECLYQDLVETLNTSLQGKRTNVWKTNYCSMTDKNTKTPTKINFWLPDCVIFVRKSQSIMIPRATFSQN